MPNFAGERVAIDDTMTDYNLGYDKSGQIMGEAMGRMYGNIGDAISGLAKGYEDYKAKQEENELNAVQNEVYRQTDQLNNEYFQSMGLDLNSPSGANQGLGDGGLLQQTEKDMTRISAARSQGTMSPLQYSIKAQQLARRARAMLPDKRDEVDKMIRGALGFRPANQLRGELESAARAQQTAADKAQWDLINNIQSASGSVGMGPYAQYAGNLADLPMEMLAEISVYQANLQQNNATLSRIDKELTVTGKIDDRQKAQAKESLGAQTRLESQAFVSTVLKEMDVKSWDELDQKINGNRQEAFRAAEFLDNQIGQQKAILTQRYVHYGNTASEAEKLAEVDLMQLSALRDSILDDSVPTSLAARQTFALADTKLQQENRAVLRWGDFNENRKLVGPDLAKSWYDNFSEGTNAAVAAINTSLTNAAMQGAPEAGWAAIGNLQGDIDKGQVAQEQVRGTTFLIQQGLSTQSPKEFKNMVTTMYDVNSMVKTMGDKSAVEVYKQMTDPAVIEAIKASNDPDAWAAVGRFVQDGFMKLQGMRQAGGTLGENFGEVARFAKAAFAEDGTVMVQFDEAGYTEWSNNASMGARNRMISNMEELEKSIATINGPLRNAAYYFKSNDQGSNLPAISEFLLSTAGTDYEKKGLINMVGDWIGDTLIAEEAFNTLTGQNFVMPGALAARERAVVEQYRQQNMPGVDRTTTGSIPQEATSTYGGDMGKRTLEPGKAGNPPATGQANNLTEGEARAGVALRKDKGVNNQWESQEELEARLGIGNQTQAEGPARRPAPGTVSLDGDLGRIGNVSDGVQTGKQVVGALASKVGAGAAAAMTANIMGETGDFKHLQEIDPLVKGSRGGVGLIQWTGPRRRQFEAWVNANGKDINSIEHNLEYLMEEAQGMHGNHWTRGYSWDEFQRIANQDPDAGMTYFMKGFLRPGIPHEAGRRSRLQKLLA